MTPLNSGNSAEELEEMLEATAKEVFRRIVLPYLHYTAYLGLDGTKRLGKSIFSSACSITGYMVGSHVKLDEYLIPLLRKEHLMPVYSIEKDGKHILFVQAN